jgi:hypothetical protein
LIWLLCGALIGLLRSSTRREAEILVLRHQLNVLKRQAPILLPCAKHVWAQVAAGELCHGIFRSLAAGQVDPMSKFKIKVARIETVAGAEEDTQVRITFQVDRGLITFQVPIFLSIRDFDDSEMVQAARSTLYRMFVELAAQSQSWKLSAKDLQQLSNMSLRPKA